MWYATAGAIWFSLVFSKHASIPNGRPEHRILLKTLLDRFDNRVHHTLVLNQLRGGDFTILKNSGQLERAMALGARTVSIKRLHESAINKIDASSSFWAAKNSADKEATGLGLMDRQRVKTWLRDSYQELDKLGV